MKHVFIKLALLSILTFAAAYTFAHQPQSQNPPASSGQSQAQQPAEPPPHVDQEPNPDDRALESSIKDELAKDAHMTYSRISVHVTDTEIMLTGVVLTNTAKDQAEKIAGEHAGNRKIENQLKVNPNTHPGPGL